VLFLTDSLSDLDGVGRYAMRLIAALERAEPGLEVEVLLARKHRPTSSQVPAHWRVSVALPPDYFFYMSKPRFWTWYLLGVARSWRPARRADLVHAIKDYPHSLIALTAARLAGKPCLATAHGTYTIQPLLDPRHAARARRTYRGLARMISVSAYTRRRLLAILGAGVIDPERVEVVPNAVAAEHYRAAREIGHRPWHDVPFTLGIGEFKERKGHHLAVEAWCRVARERDDLHHFIVGKHSGDAYQAALLERARRDGLEDRLHLLGNVSEDEKIDLLQRAQVFVHTPVTSSDGGFEGFGIVYLEAAAAGTPSIGTLDSGAEDAVVDGKSGRLVAQDPAAVEAALRELLGDDDLRARMAETARAHAAATSWDANAARVLAAYREVLGS
jgi:phosphatidylinositol alpha-1,6-mannosyltransferase